VAFCREVQGQGCLLTDQTVKIPPFLGWVLVALINAYLQAVNGLVLENGAGAQGLAKRVDPFFQELRLANEMKTLTIGSPPPIGSWSRLGHRRVPREGTMASIQGISGAGAAYAISKTPVSAAPKPEVQETAQDERSEQARGLQEASETRPANPNLGTRFSALA
jgi:hypothetical protein